MQLTSLIASGPASVGIRTRLSLSKATYGTLLAAIFAHAWFASTPLPLGGPNVLLGGAAVALALALAVTRTPAGRPLAAVRNTLPAMAAALALAAWAAIVHVAHDGGSWLPIGKIAMGIGILFAVRMTVTNAGRVRWMIAAIVLATLVSAVFGLAMILVGESLWSLWIAHTAPMPDQLSAVVDGRRVAGLSSGAVNFGYLLAVAVPSAIALLLYNPLHGRGARLARDGGLAALLVVLLAALLANASRSAFLGAACGSLLVLLSPVLASAEAGRRMRRRRFLLVQSMAVMAALLLLLFTNGSAQSPFMVRPPVPAELPGPETGCVESLGTLSAAVSRTGDWNGDCAAGSLQREGSHARYYRFSLDGDGPLTIDLSSADANAYAYLYSSTEAGDELVALNDNGARWVGGGALDARISITAVPAGTYVVEAATHAPGVAGEFTLGVTPTSCRHYLGEVPGETLHGAGDWNGDCPLSTGRDGSYARHFTFFVNREGPVTIQLESEEARPHLFLFAGTAPGGDALAHEQWRIEGDWSSRMTLDHLPVGTYALEATTHLAESTGSFALRIDYDAPVLPGDDFPLPPRQSLVMTRDRGLDRISTLDDESARSRAPLALAALRYALDHPLGTGEYAPDASHLSADLDPIIADIVLLKSPHNQFLKVLALWGFPGLALLVWFYGCVLRSFVSAARLARRRGDAEASFLIAAVGGALAAYLINSNFQPKGPFTDDWHHFFLIGLVSSVERICSAPPPVADGGSAEAVGAH